MFSRPLQFIRHLMFSGCCLLGALSLHAQVNVTTQHNDNARTGQNTLETTLTSVNVNSNDFGLLFPLTVDGQVYAQPLVLSNVSINGGTHSVVYVATENDSVYALDANNGALYWKVPFAPPASGITAPTASQIGCSDISPEYGITSTPVIDPSSGTIYIVANTYENGVYYYRLHALNVITGAEQSGSPVVISDPNGVFNAQDQNQRTGLLLTNGHIIFGFSAHCDHSSWNGWVFSYNASTLAQEAVFLPVPESNGGQAGVWMGGAGLAADAGGNLFFSTGNGDFDGSSSFGDTILKLPTPTASGTWTPLDWYSPADNASLESGDFDLGSGGVVLLPDLPNGVPHYQLLAQAGKEGKISIVDRNSMGHFCCSPGGPDTNIVQEISGQLTTGMYGSPSYWNGHIYFGGSDDYVKAFSFNLSDGSVSASPVAYSPTTYGSGAHQSGTTSVSSNGTTNGILWVLDSGTGILHALDASTLSELYNSDQVPARDSLSGGGIKFLAPTVANGKVYVGSNGQLGIYGEFPTELVWSGGQTESTSACNGQIGSVSVTAVQSGINSVSWSISGLAGQPVLSNYWTINDSTGTLGTGTISGGSGTVTVSRAPFSQPTVSGSLAIDFAVGRVRYRCSVSYSFVTQGQP